MSDTPETDACKSAARGESIFDLCEKLERERDETHSILEQVTDRLEQATIELIKLQSQRDEAREQNAKLRDIAERAIGGLEFKYKLHCGADIQLGIRAELKQLKEGAK